MSHAPGGSSGGPAGVTSAAQRGGTNVGFSRRLGAALIAAVALLGTAQVAQAAAPKWSSVRVQKISEGVPWTEPRITTGPDGTLWLVTNGEKASHSACGGEQNTAPTVVIDRTDPGKT